MTTSVLPSSGGDPSRGLVSMSSAVDSPASLSASPGRVLPSVTNDGSGLKWMSSSTPSDRSGCCGKMCPACETVDWTSSTPTLFDVDTDTESDGFELARWAPHIHEPGCSEWPTPRATDGERGGRGDLLAKLRSGNTSRRKEWNGEPRRGHDRGIGQVSPRWLAWLMGFPEGWLSGVDAPLVMRSSRRSPSTSAD